MNAKQDADASLRRQPTDEDTGHTSSGSRNGQTGRILCLLQLLMFNECTRKDVFERLASYYNIDPVAPDAQNGSRKADRTFERDIAFLEEQGFELKKVKTSEKSISYSLMKGSGPHMPLLFTTTEVDGLALLYNMFADPTRYAQIDPTQPLPMQSQATHLQKRYCH